MLTMKGSLIMEKNYYAKKLNSQKLLQVYQTQIPRVKQYFDFEISFVRKDLKGNERVLELGAGYGRIVKELAPDCLSIIGIDISEDNVLLGEEYLKDMPNAQLQVMDAHNLSFDEQFDVILCLQNGLSAMKVDPIDFVKKILSLLSNGGKAYFSSYSAKFWDFRLEWFQEQAAKGLLGEIDLDKTKDGVIVCKDGFKATTHSPDDMEKIGKASGCEYQVTEVGESSIFLVITQE